MLDTEDKHCEIELSTFNKMINKGEYYKDFTVDLSMVNNVENDKNLLFSNGECCGGSIELRFNSHLFSNY